MSIVELYKQAESCGNIQEALPLYNELIKISTPSDSEVLQLKEAAILKVANSLKTPEELSSFVRGLENVWNVFSRVKASKLIKTLLDLFEKLPNSLAHHIQLTKDLLQWCSSENRIFLKQFLQSRLAHLLLASKSYTEAITLINEMLRELKRLDDKLNLVDAHLLECQVYYDLKNMPKAKAALTAARTAANSIYCPPLVLANLDLQAGLLHSAEEDFKTAYSYFIESLEAFVSASVDPRGILPLKYMLLCKIMLNSVEDIDSIVNGKLGQKYSLGMGVEAMKAVGQAYKDKSLKEFEQALQKYPSELSQDPAIQTHFQSLYDSLLEQNLLSIVRSYSRIQIDFIAQSIGLQQSQIESKLSQMILDHKLDAVLDQSDNCLIIVEKPVYDVHLIYLLYYRTLLNWHWILSSNWILLSIFCTKRLKEINIHK